MSDGNDVGDVFARSGRARPLDAIDRRISGELAIDATLSYAALSSRVGLSAAAVHERVRRLRASGAIRATRADLDGAAMGKPLLCFVHVDAVGHGRGHVLANLGGLPEVEELHSATGEGSIIVKARVASPSALDGLLARVEDLEGVRGTKTFLALSTCLERGVQAGVTAELEESDRVRA
jgi:DNA-binding Lrp family transcriptional regulator